MALTCPRDGSPLETKTYEAKIEVDVCPSCGGIWLDKGELEAIQEAKENDYSPVGCLKCAAEMDTREYAYCSQIVIDTCPEGCGIWLDAGELQALEKFFERSQAEAGDVIPLRWRLWATVAGVFRKKG